MPPAMSSSQQEEACDSASETDHQAVAREAAVKVQEDFDARSELKDVNPDAAIALYDPEEVLVEDTIYSGFFCIVSALRGISLRPSHFEDSIEEHRDRFAGRSHDGHYALKSISPESVKQDEETARIAAATLMIEAKILMNLAPHPHICQLYGLNASGTNTAFGSKISQDGFFLIIDSISETLPQRMTAWREKRCYHEEERFDDLKTKQSQLTQRLEVALDICSPMIFLSKRKIVYCFHPEKCGFDSRYKRIKLFHFGHARESGKEPYSIFINEDMRYRAYLAPEIFKRGTVTCDADVYAFGMLLWEILTLKHPLEGMSNASHITQVVNGRTRPPINKTWPESIRKLIESCWTATDRPTMKEVYDSLKEVHDSLEHFLLFQQDVEGIERTEDQISGMAPQVESTKRRIKYERTGETVTEEERDKDSKSVKSRESVRSRDSKVSVRSNRSRGSAENKTERRPRRKSNDQVCVEESALQVSQEDKGEPLLLKVADSGRDEKPVEDAADSKSPSHVKDKNGRIRRNRSYSADDIIVNDDDEQSSGRRSTSSRLSSVRDKDGKIRRTAVKPDTSNDDNESTAHKSVGSNESLSRRRRPPSGRGVSKRNLHDTLEGLGKDEDVPTPDGNQRQRSSRHLSRDRVEKPEDDKGEASLPKVADSGSHEKPVEDAADSKSPSHVKDKNGRIRRNRSYSADDIIVNDDDDQSSGRRSTSSRLSSVRDKDGKIRRTAVKPDTSNDDNESTAHKSVGSNESLSRRRRPPSGREASKRNLHDTLEGLGKDEDVATPDGNQRQRSSRHLSRDGVVEKPEDDKGEPSSLPKVADSLSSVKDKDGKIRRTAVKPDTSNDDNESTAHKSVGSNESLSRRRRPPSRMVSKRNLHDMRPNMESNGKNEGGGRILRRGVARSKSSDDGLLSHQASSPRRAAVLGSENNDTEDESCGRPLGSPHRGVARSRSSDEALKQQLSSRRLISAENSPRRAAAGSENNDTEESGGRPMGSPRRGVARSRSSDETLKQQLSSRRLTSAENNDNNDESGTGRAADACLSRRNILARSKSSGDGAPNDQPPSRTRPMNRRKSGDNALTFMAATTSRKAPATRRMGRRRSVSATTYLAARSVQPASSVREAPSQRLVGRSASSGKEIPGITAWLGGAPIEEPKSRDGGFADFDGSSFPDLGVVERHKNKKASEENNFSLSMSEHSNWVDLAVADKKQDEKKDPAASSNPFGNKTEKMRSGSENDTKGAIRKRILDKAKEMAKEKEERERAAHGLPISEDFQRRRVQVAATTAAAATRGPVVISRQRSTRQLKRAP